MRNALVLLLVFSAPAGAALPSFETVRTQYAMSDAQLLDRHGALLHELRVDAGLRRLEWTGLADISPALQQAIVRAEDRHFFEHAGVDWRAVGASAWALLWGDRHRGASTITMQLAARLDPALAPAQGRRSVAEKWRQMQAARELERSWSKQQILEAYLNLVDFRGELRGVGAAARGLFDKAPSGVNEPEALLLAALLRAPQAAPETVAERACVLGDVDAAGPECAAIARLAQQCLRAPYRVRALVADAPHVARALLKEPGGRVVSTLDARLQRFAARALAQQLAGLSGERVQDGAVLVVDNAGGEVLAYVGNRGDGYVDGVIAPRQAGSTLKPFLYGLAIERRWLTAASVLDDAPVNIVTPTGLYVPHNYDNDFKGLVSVRTSLASSLNVPAVRTLMLVGAGTFVERLRSFGFEGLSENGDFYGYSLALGSGDVTLWQLVNAYRTLANGGRYSPLALGSRTRRERPRAVMGSGAAFIVSDILADRAARSATFGLENVLATRHWSAVKTGTSKDMRDNWCVGFSRRYTVGVWVGNFNGEPMRNVSGVTGAAPVWSDVMDYLHRGRGSAAPAPPADVVARDVQFVPALESPRREWFLRGTEVTRIDVVAPAAETARISYPGQGATLALDPDIPPNRQRVFFRATHAAGSWHWRLDGVEVPDAWAPSAGRHRLELVDATGTVRDSVSFVVRGADAPLGVDPVPAVE